MNEWRYPSTNAPIAETWLEAFANVRAQGKRSALALLGILIGTASIVAMLEIGYSAQRETLKLFKNMGVDMLQVQAAPSGRAPAWLDRATIERLPSDSGAILGSAPMDVGRSDAAVQGQRTDMPVVGATPALFDLAGLGIAHGRALSAIDERSGAVVLGDQAAAKLSMPGAQILPGARVQLGGYVFTVVGILQPVTATGLDPVDYANAAFISLDGAARVLPNPFPTTALLRLRPQADVTVLTAKLIERLSSPGAVIQVQSARDLIRTMNAQKAINSRLLAAIGGISLLVGGIGVMNVMLMGIMERRGEIGLRAAIGASPRDLQLMFVIESGTLALLGGCAGALLGVSAAYVTAHASGWDFSLALYVLPLGVAMAAVTGVVFGLYPAVKASRLDPIEALRAD